MGLFEKKYCDICGEKIGLLGNRKVEDGNICSKCAGKLSPFFSGRKKSTVEDIKRQLKYREENRQNLNYFNPTRIFGNYTKVYIDDAQQSFVVSRKSDYRSENADIIALSNVTNVRYEVEEHRSEIYRKDSENRNVSYDPPRYEYEYEMTIYIDVNSPYFSEIEFELTDNRPDSRYTEEFRRYEQEANEIVMALRGGSPMNGGMNMAGGMYAQQMNPQQMQGGFMNQPYQQPQQYGQQGYQQPNQFQQQGYPQQPQQFQQQGYPQQPQQFQQQGYQQQPQQFRQQGYQQQPQQFQQQGYQQQPQQFQQQNFNQQPQQWTCPNCGTVTMSKFCENCGTPKPF